MSTPLGHQINPGGVYSRGQTRHAHSPLTGITGVSMPIGNHPASEANTASNNHQYDGRGVSPVSDEEYEGFKSEFCSLETLQSCSFLCPSPGYPFAHFAKIVKLGWIHGGYILYNRQFTVFSWLREKQCHSRFNHSIVKIEKVQKQKCCLRLWFKFFELKRIQKPL